MPASKSCPQCGYTHVTVMLSRTMEYLASSCSRCGWDSEHRPRIYSMEEAREEVIEAARDLLFDHTSIGRALRRRCYVSNSGRDTSQPGVCY